MSRFLEQGLTSGPRRDIMVPFFPSSKAPQSLAETLEQNLLATVQVSGRDIVLEGVQSQYRYEAIVQSIVLSH